MKRILSIILTVVLSIGILNACSAGKSSSGGASENSDVYDNMTEEEAKIARSYLAAGNTERLNAAVDKAKSGKDVTIAYIGGSITEGVGATPDTCYAALSAKDFEEKYCVDSKVNFVNAGMSGTPSMIGCARVSRDVAPYDPDIVFVEFAVNDGTDTEYKKSYESLVRTLLKLESKPCVILIFTILENGHTCQEQMRQVGEHYDLGMISVADSLTAEFDAGRMTWKDYSDDSSHPNSYGHLLISQYIEYYYEQALIGGENTEYIMPDETVYGNEFEDCVYIDAQDIEAESFGSFVPAMTMSQFPNGLANAQDGTNDALKFSVDCKSIIFIYKQTAVDPWGNAQLLVNGLTETVLMGKMTGGWGGPAFYALTSDETKTYDIELKMVDTSIDKKFELVAIGVVY